ncbi:MAG: single-stranded-DNA-specific exonuclease RecJ [Hyphomicrobiaceae bacterium]|nr:single-stranded-DNA-specific exonuclease RecJ [Hyphomicrobiaceae bacterium]
MVALRKSDFAAPLAAAEISAFLGVESSIKGNVWRERLPGAQRNAAAAICQHHSLPELLGRVLAARGVTMDTVPVFLDPTVKALMPDPSTLRDMDKAAARIAKAVQAREKVAIFGDYDVDGACSSALLSRFLTHHGVASRIYIPDRITEGYGPNAAAIEHLIKDGAQLIVTVDCGTTSFDALAAAKPLGRDVVVLDHHQADDRLPDVHCLVNPNRQDDVSGQGHLCAAGVVFLVLVAVTRVLRQAGFYGGDVREPNLLQSLDLVALATVADVVPLTGLNRAYVTKGLAVMRSRDNIGLRALADAAGINQAPTPYHLGFILGPRINAGGRISDAALGARLLCCEDEVEAQRIAQKLDTLNKERRTIEQVMLEEALAEADRLVDETPDLAVVAVGSDTWHKGVVGLVASRLVERFGRPSCVIAWEKDGSSGDVVGTGSLRSVAGVDIGSAVRAAMAAGHLIKGGGHAMAAGLTVRKAGMPVLQAFFATAVGAAAKAARERTGLDIDGALTPGGVTEELVSLLERAGPYGQGNPQPRFVLPAVRVKYPKVVGEAHLRCALEGSDGRRIDAVAFRAVGQPLGDLIAATAGMPLHVAGTVKRDTWGGRERLEFIIDDAAPVSRG